VAVARSTLLHLWQLGTFRPHHAFDALQAMPAPAWGFRVVVAFNLTISLTSLLALQLLGRNPLLPSSLTFLPTERYYLAEMAFLPLLRTATWLLGAATSHLAIRLTGRPSEVDTILNIGGLVYLVVMPYTFAVDWTAIALDAYDFGLIAILHGSIDLVWSVALLTIGLRRLLLVPTTLALASALLSATTTLPLLAIFAR